MSDKQLQSVISECENDGDNCCRDVAGKDDGMLERHVDRTRALHNIQTDVALEATIVRYVVERDNGIARQQMVSRTAANISKMHLEVAPTVRKENEEEVNSIMPMTPSSSNCELANVEDDELIWVHVSCADNSGACANVSPDGVFTKLKLDPKYWGARGTRIVNLR